MKSSIIGHRPTAPNLKNNPSNSGLFAQVFSGQPDPLIWASSSLGRCYLCGRCSRPDPDGG